MIAVHLTASPFLGGPERQMLGLAASLPTDVRTVHLAFTEGGQARPFLDELGRARVEAVELVENAPRYRAAVAEVADHLRQLDADVLLCHGYKADILGLAASRRARVPAVAVSRGWTAATLKVRLNEALDRFCLRRMDRVVCVSEGQAAKVRRGGVAPERIVVIRNSIHAKRFDQVDLSARDELFELLDGRRPERLVGAAGRLSPEKGFEILIGAAAILARDGPNTGFIVFGDGPLRSKLLGAIKAQGLQGRFVLAGFRDDLDRLLPHLDLLAVPSYTEGLPNVALEASAAGVPIVATAVGGDPEIVRDGENGRIVPPGDPRALARAIGKLLGEDQLRQHMGAHRHELVSSEFTFEARASRYLELFKEISRRKSDPAAN